MKKGILTGGEVSDELEVMVATKGKKEDYFLGMVAQAIEPK
jgi:hypothetical protein